MDVAHRGGPVAAVAGAVLVAVSDRDPLGPVVEASAAAEVEDLGVAAEHVRFHRRLGGVPRLPLPADRVSSG